MHDAQGARGRVASNFIWLMFDRGFSAVVALAVAAYVTRYLGAERLGLLSYAQGSLFIVGVLCGLGLDHLLVRELVQKPEQRDELLGTSLLLRLGGAVVAALLLLGLGLLFPAPGRPWPLIWILSVALLFDAFGVVPRFFEANVDSKRVLKFRMVSFLLYNGLRLWLVFLEAELSFFAWAVVAGGVLNLLAHLAAYRQGGHRMGRWRFRTSVARRLLSDGWPTMLSGLAVHIQLRIDQVMLGEMVGADALGQYAAAIRLSDFTLALPTAVAASLGPLVAKSKVSGEPQFKQEMQNLHRALLVAGLPSSVFLLLFGAPLVQLLFGEAFAVAGTLTAAMSLRLLYNHFAAGRRVFIVNEGLFRASLVTLLAMALLNVVGNWWAIPRWGVWGALTATLTASCALFSFDLLHGRLRQHVWWMVSAWPTSGRWLMQLVRGGWRAWP